MNTTSNLYLGQLIAIKITVGIYVNTTSNEEFFGCNIPNGYEYKNVNKIIKCTISRIDGNYIEVYTDYHRCRSNGYARHKEKKQDICSCGTGHQYHPALQSRYRAGRVLLRGPGPSGLLDHNGDLPEQCS